MTKKSQSQSIDFDQQSKFCKIREPKDCDISFRTTFSNRSFFICPNGRFHRLLLKRKVTSGLSNQKRFLSSLLSNSPKFLFLIPIKINWAILIVYLFKGEFILCFFFSIHWNFVHFIYFVQIFFFCGTKIKVFFGGSLLFVLFSFFWLRSYFYGRSAFKRKIWWNPMEFVINPAPILIEIESKRGEIMTNLRFFSKFA